MNRLALIVLGTFLCTLGVLAQDQKLAFSLDEAYNYALEHNKTLQNSKRDIKLAHQQFREALGPGLPQVDATLDYMTNFNYEFALDFGGGSSEPPQIDYTQLDAGDQEILSLLAQMNSGSQSTIVMEDQSNANIRVTQLLFSGQYWVGLQMAKLSKEIANKNYTISELDIKQNVNNNYTIILVTEDLIRILEETRENMETLLEHTQNMYKMGMMEQTDVDQITIRLSEIENSKQSMERNLSLSYNMLRFLLGIPSTQEVTLTDSLDALLQFVDSEGLFNNSFDIENNPTYQIIKTQEELMNKNVNVQRWAYAPTIGAYYNYTEKLLTTAFDLSPNHAAGLNLSLPIVSGGTKMAQVSQAKIELDKATTTREMLEDQLEMQNKQYLYELQSAYSNYNTQKENVAVAKRMYESMNNKYKQGTASSMDLTQASATYLQAQSNFISSKSELIQAKTNLDKLVNKL